MLIFLFHAAYIDIDNAEIEGKTLNEFKHFSLKMVIN